MAVKIEKKSSNSIYALLDGDIDHHSAKGIREKIDEEIEKNRPNLLTLDFGKVNFMDSSGIGLILGRYKLMKFLKGNIEIINASPRIERIIKLSGICKLKSS